MSKKKHNVTLVAPGFIEAYFEFKKRQSKTPLLDLQKEAGLHRNKRQEVIKEINDALVSYFDERGIYYDRDVDQHQAIASVLLAAIYGGARVEALHYVAFSVAQLIDQHSGHENFDLAVDEDNAVSYPIKKIKRLENKTSRGRKPATRRNQDLVIAVDRLVLCDGLSIAKACEQVAATAKPCIEPDTVKRLYNEYRPYIVPAYTEEMLWTVFEWLEKHGKDGWHKPEMVKELRRIISPGKKKRGFIALITGNNFF